MALEVLARMSHLLIAENKTLAGQLISPLSPLVKTHLSERKAIFELLKDMRPVLNRINETNPNITTLPLASVRFIDSLLSQGSWLDLCESCFCFYSETNELYFKFPYESILSMETDLRGRRLVVRKSYDVDKMFLN